MFANETLCASNTWKFHDHWIKNEFWILHCPVCAIRVLVVSGINISLVVVILTLITLPNQGLSVSNALAHVKFNFLEFLSYRKHYDKSSVRYMMSFEVSLEHFVLLPQITQGKANVLTDHPSLWAMLGIYAFPNTTVLQYNYSST